MLLFEAKYVGEGREREKISWERLSKREKKKKIVPMNSYPTRNRKFKKSSKKIHKKLKNTIVASFQAKISWGRPRKRGKKKQKKSFR